jgi:hypothetical protein
MIPTEEGLLRGIDLFIQVASSAYRSVCSEELSSRKRLIDKAPFA